MTSLTELQALKDAYWRASRKSEEAWREYTGYQDGKYATPGICDLETDQSAINQSAEHCEELSRLTAKAYSDLQEAYSDYIDVAMVEDGYSGR